MQEAKLSKQRRYQIARRASGRCIQCGKPAVTKNHCAVCQGKANRRRMEYYFRKVRKRIDKTKQKSDTCFDTIKPE